MNKIVLLGRLVRDVEENNGIGKLTLAVPRKLSKEKIVDFINCVAFGNIVKPLIEYTKKGNRLLIEGRLQIENYVDKEGNNKQSINVVISDFYFLDYNTEIKGQIEINK